MHIITTERALAEAIKRDLQPVERAIMAKLSDFAASIKSKLDDQETKLQSWKSRIDAALAAASANDGTLSDADAASLQAISDEVDTHSTEIDNFQTTTVAPVIADPGAATTPVADPITVTG